MEYHVIFDISQTPYQWWWPALGLVIVGLGLLLLFFQKRRPSYRQLSESQIWIAIVGALVWTALAFIATYATYRDARSLYQQGHYALVEGQIEHFIPDTLQSKAPESFDVQGVHFEYSSARVTAGFNQTHTQGGPIKEGLFVRIYYSPDTANSILRLEIKQ